MFYDQNNKWVPSQWALWLLAHNLTLWLQKFLQFNWCVTPNLTWNYIEIVHEMLLNGSAWDHLVSEIDKEVLRGRLWQFYKALTISVTQVNHKNRTIYFLWYSTDTTWKEWGFKQHYIIKLINQFKYWRTGICFHFKH